jgi:single-strand DNA-binding protein
MASLNRVTLIGNIGKDPELRYTTSGQAVASFSLATTDKFKSKNGQYEERTEWHSIVIFGKQAELLAEYTHKGSALLVEGRLQTRKWQDKDGKDRYSTEIVSDHFQMLDKKQPAVPEG